MRFRGDAAPNQYQMTDQKPDPEMETQALQNQAKILREQLDFIENRLAEIKTGTAEQPTIALFLSTAGRCGWINHSAEVEVCMLYESRDESRDNHFRKGTMIKIRHEVMPFIGIIAAIGVCIGFLLNAIMPGVAFILGGTAFLLFFFRDPERNPPPDPALLFSALQHFVPGVRVPAHRLLLCRRISAEGHCVLLLDICSPARSETSWGNLHHKSIRSGAV
jgi:hypothetical protein